MNIGLFFIIFVNICYPINLIFVHIGNDFPSYAYYSIYQARLFNSSSDFYLILSKKCHSASNKNLLHNLKVNIFFIEDLIKTRDHKLFLINKKKINSFWVNTSERVFYIESLAKKLNLVDIFHIENDVLVYFDFSSKLSTFRKYGNIAAVFDSDNRGILSIVYFKDFNSVGYLSKAMAELSKNNYNDMEILAYLKKTQPAFVIDNLPIAPTDYLADNKLSNNIGESAKNPRDYIRNFEEFTSFFDGAAFGQYIGGIHTNPVPGFINETSFVNPSKFKISWEDSLNGLRVPILFYNSKKYYINNLHIHSKQLDKFLSSPFRNI